MSVDQIGALIVLILGMGGIVTAAYLGYRYRGMSDESDRLKANQEARKESDANLETLKNLAPDDLSKRVAPWVRD